MRVLGGVAHAKIKCEPGQKNAGKAPFPQIAYEACRRLSIVLVEGGVGVDRAMNAFAQHEPGVGNVQILVEFRAARGSNAMVRPKDLRSIVNKDRVVRLPAGML
jgi:hypothetical protein